MSPRILAICILSFVAITFASPVPGGWKKYEHHIIHVPYNVHHVHHIHKVPIYIKSKPIIIKEPVYEHHDHHEHHEEWPSSYSSSGHGWDWD